MFSASTPASTGACSSPFSSLLIGKMFSAGRKRRPAAPADQPLSSLLIGKMFSATPSNTDHLPSCHLSVPSSSGKCFQRRSITVYTTPDFVLSVPSSSGKCFQPLQKARRNKAFFRHDMVNFSKSYFLHELPSGLRNRHFKRYLHRNSCTRSPCNGFLPGWAGASLPFRSFAGFPKALFSFGPLGHPSSQIRLRH
jgi:hypothetical protein